MLARQLQALRGTDSHAEEAQLLATVDTLLKAGPPSLGQCEEKLFSVGSPQPRSQGGNGHLYFIRHSSWLSGPGTMSPQGILFFRGQHKSPTECQPM